MATENKELISIVEKYSFVAPTESMYRHNDLMVMSVPTMDELDAFVCEYMTTVGRCLRIRVAEYLYKDDKMPLTEEERKEFLRLITELSLKYYPWQFHTTVQLDVTYDIDWVEVDEWVDPKYGEK